jgi:hypothetical protein
MFGCKSIGRRPTQTRRVLRHEVLETRDMLSHPAVAAVNVASTDWTPSFISYLETAQLGVGGYAIPVGSANQLKTLPWTNINQIRITFSEDVCVDAADLSISGVNTTALAFSAFDYDSLTCTAVWTLAAPITKDKLMLDLDAEGMDPVVSVSTGEALYGGWTDCVSTFPSGSGQTVEDFQFRFNVLPGDVDGNNAVMLGDILLTRSKIGQTVNDPGYNFRCDVDGNGVITSIDQNLVAAKFGGTLPAGNPAGMTNDAPTTTGITDMFFNTYGGGGSLSLTDFFADEETSSDNMAFTVIGNTNPSLFDSLSIDSSGQLTIDLTDNAKGEAVLTIRAIDEGGLFVDIDFTVHASKAPAITNFYCINTYMDCWTLTGTVIDDDDPVEGYVVHFGGRLASYGLTATVREDGVFTLYVELEGLIEGTGTAQTQDPHGILSNLAQYWIVV